MRETQSVFVLAGIEKDKDNYLLNRQSTRWRPHNQGSVCIFWSFHKAAGQQPHNLKDREKTWASGNPTGLIMSQLGLGHLGMYLKGKSHVQWKVK